MCVPYSIYEAGREVFVQNLISNPSIGEFNLQKFNQDLCSWLSLQSQHFKVFFSTYNYTKSSWLFLTFWPKSQWKRLQKLWRWQRPLSRTRVKNVKKIKWLWNSPVSQDQCCPELIFGPYSCIQPIACLKIEDFIIRFK